MMSGSHSFVNTAYLLGAISLSMILNGCDSDEATVQAPMAVRIGSSVTEGVGPLSVTFDVSGAGIEIFRATWDFGDGETAQTVGSASILHTFLNAGEYTVSASVRSNSLSARSDVPTITVIVLPNVNLIVSSFAIDTEVTPGGLETVSAIIQNIGTDTLEFGLGGLIRVGYYLSTDDTITVDDIFIGDTSILLGDFFSPGDFGATFSVQSLSPGENYQYDHQLAVKGNIPGGTYFTGAIVDYIDEFDWYTFPRGTDTEEFIFPAHVIISESNEDDNVRVLPAHQVTVIAPTCVDDPFEPDDGSAAARTITVGVTQTHNFCFDNSDWLQFDAVQGSVYKITTSSLGVEADTQLILYDLDGSSILLFHDNGGTPIEITETLDLESGFPPIPASEIVWETQVTGTYFIKVRTTACDEDLDNHCVLSPDGVGLATEYNITLQ